MTLLWSNFLGIGSAIVSLLLIIDSAVYWFISQLYNLYVILARAKIFSSEMYTDIANKVYLIMGVVALFICVYTLLISIINPDDLQKSGINFVKKFFIGIIMIVLTPAIFNFLYTFQNAILTDNIIQKIFFTDNFTTSQDSYITYLYDYDNPNKTDEEYREEIKNGSISLSDFKLDEDGTITNGKVIRYVFDDKCQYDQTTDYANAVKNCNKLSIQAKNDRIVTSYGNYMAFVVLEAFLHPAPGHENETVNASEFVKSDNILETIGIGCLAGGIAAVVIGFTSVISAGVTGGASIVPGLTAAGNIAGTTCGIGIATSLVGNSVLSAITYEAYTWDMAKAEMVYNGDFTRITAFAGDSDEGIVSGKFEYIPIVSTISGLIVVYMLLSYCIDLGVRAAKLAFYQMFAPVSFLLNTLPGQQNLLNNWIKVVLTTWGEVFIRLFTMLAAVYLISNLNMLELSGYGLLAKAIIVIGIITFVRQFPKLLGDITGIKSENMNLGIMSKLGAGGALAAGALIGGGLTAGVKNFTNSWKNSKGRGFGRFTSSLKSGLAGAASGGFRSAKSAGFNAKNWGDMKNAASAGGAAAHKKAKDRIAYKASHGGTTFGALTGHVKDAWSGIKNWSGVRGDVLDTVQFEDDYINNFGDYENLYNNGSYQAMVSQLNSYQARVNSGESLTNETFVGSGITLDDAIRNTKTQMRYERLAAIKKNTDAAAYAAYNLAMQVKADPNMAARSGVSNDFIAHADDFVLKNNQIWHKNGSAWTDSELQQLFEGHVATTYDSKGNVVADSKSAIYTGLDKGLNGTKSDVKAQQKKDKTSIAYKEAQKAKNNK